MVYWSGGLKVRAGRDCRLGEAVFSDGSHTGDVKTGAEHKNKREKELELGHTK